MQGKIILLGEVMVALFFLWIGIFDIKVWFIDGPRMAAIALGIIGGLFCIKNAFLFLFHQTGHPMTALGSFVGVIAMVTLLVQIFELNIVIIGDPIIALVILSICIVLKGVMGRFYPLVEAGEQIGRAHV